MSIKNHPHYRGNQEIWAQTCITKGIVVPQKRRPYLNNPEIRERMQSLLQNGGR